MRKTLAALLGAAFAGMLAGACNSPPPTSEYDHRCATVTDCVAVGDACDGGCGCPSDAINKGALRAFQADHAGCKSTIACDCVARTVLCTAGKCGVEPLPGGSGW